MLPYNRQLDSMDVDEEAGDFQQPAAGSHIGRLGVHLQGNGDLGPLVSGRDWRVVGT